MRMTINRRTMTEVEELLVASRSLSGRVAGEVFRCLFWGK